MLVTSVGIHLNYVVFLQAALFNQSVADEIQLIGDKHIDIGLRHITDIRTPSSTLLYNIIVNVPASRMGRIMKSIYPVFVFI